MIKCWVIGTKLKYGVHRVVHRAVHRMHHHYHSPALKILGAAIVCVSTGAGLAPWLAPKGPPIAQNLAPAVQSHAPTTFLSSAPPADWGFLDPAATDFPGPDILPSASEIPPEFMTVGIEVILPSSPSQPDIGQSVPEPSSCLLLSTVIGFLVIGRAMRRHQHKIAHLHGPR